MGELPESQKVKMLLSFLKGILKDDLTGIHPDDLLTFSCKPTYGSMQQSCEWLPTVDVVRVQEILTVACIA